MTVHNSVSSRQESNQPSVNLGEENPNWVEAESIRAFMPTQQQTQVIALFVIPIVFFVLYGHVNMYGLVIWAFFSVLLAIYRWRLTTYYMMHLIESSASDQIQFRRKNAWTWPATSFLWGTLVFLFFSKSPLFNQLVSFVVLASIGVFSATGYATHFKTLKLFINTMMITLLSGMTWHYFTNTAAAEISMIYMIFPLQLIFWKLLFLIGARLNQSHLQGLKLRKGNQDLIASLQDQTARANNAIETKNRLLASAAHDIRQPVLALDVYANMLRTEPELAKELTEKIEIATKSVINMFDSLFDLARIESSQIKVNKTNVHLPELFRELYLQYQPAAQAKKLDLRLRSKQFDIYTDHQLIKRILGNLVMNAIKFTDKGGVLLACRQTKQGLRFEVWDTGVGIPLDQQEAVFKEFYKSPSHSGTSDGFGLGLSIVARLCEPLDYKFALRSRIGRGSVFCIEAPSLVCFTAVTNPAGVRKK
ncbi:MAG: HAMP domain-containing sensor histidine kinase [Burkholderiaceae bacterium]